MSLQQVSDGLKSQLITQCKERKQLTSTSGQCLGSAVSPCTCLPPHNCSGPNPPGPLTQQWGSGLLHVPVNWLLTQCSWKSVSLRAIASHLCCMHGGSDKQLVAMSAKLNFRRQTAQPYEAPTNPLPAHSPFPSHQAKLVLATWHQWSHIATYMLLGWGCRAAGHAGSPAEAGLSGECPYQ